MEAGQRVQLDAGERPSHRPLTPLDLGVRLQGTPFPLIAPPVSPDRGVRSFPATQRV